MQSSLLLTIAGQTLRVTGEGLQIEFQAKASEDNGATGQGADAELTDCMTGEVSRGVGDRAPTATTENGRDGVERHAPELQSAGQVAPAPIPAPGESAADEISPVIQAARHGEALRFFREVVLPYDGDECLLWPYYRNEDGYGRLRYEGLFQYVNRLVCEHVNGPPPTPDHEAAHSCGKGHEACCTKRHLSWKTKVENEADKIAHGTILRGERHHSNKLTEQDAREILSLKGKLPSREIASRFGITKRTVAMIQQGVRWGWLADQASTPNSNSVTSAPPDVTEPQTGEVNPPASPVITIKAGPLTLSGPGGDRGTQSFDAVGGAKMEGRLTASPDRPGHVHAQSKQAAKEFKLRPHCKRPSLCGGYGKIHCASCLRAAPGLVEAA